MQSRRVTLFAQFGLCVPRFWELRDAVLTGDADTVAMLARQGANLNQVDYNGRSALHMACAEGNYKVVEVMIQQGANINMKDRWGQTPLQVAVLGKHQLVVGKVQPWMLEAFVSL